MNKPELYVGTAGWSYEDWLKVFYPFNQSRDFSWLKFYSRFFNHVEVNSTYYTYLSPKIAENWMRQIEQGNDFYFTVKLHLDFTHRKIYGDEQIKSVKTNLEIIKENNRLAGLLIQFPYSFNLCEANINYLKSLIKIFEEYDQFIELRHKSWQSKTPKTVTFCSIDQPQIGDTVDFIPKVSREICYARFHGRNAEAWKKSLTGFKKPQTYQEQSERYNYLYSIGEIMEFDFKIKEIYDKAKKIFVTMNNHPNGNAIVNAFELMYFLRNKTKLNLPNTIKKAFPRLENISLN